MERIHVSVRARPLSPEEAKGSPWRISGNSICIPNQSSKFEFDRIFEEDCKTLEVYSARTKDLVAAAIRGFNGTVFAYGQTSSGKTHTMRGTASEPGVISLAVDDLFNSIHEDANREFLLRISYMEIYNEEINDLLAPEHRKLEIHESIERGIFVAGLREEIVACAEQVLGLMEFGESHRHIGETNMNVYSSRSHTIFRMIIESREKKEDADSDNSCDAVRVSVLNLVDLAGSERVAKTGAEGVRLKEGSHINKSLMTLGTVIKKLSEGVESQGGHVPYRDSKLTRILQPALGGNANTAIICNITLAQAHADETKSSLQFASRALRVTNCVHVNEILTDAALLKRQKKEIEELRAKLLGSHSEHHEEEILSLRNTLLKVELERERMALALEEEKKAQAEQEKRLEEQAKKIENLSSMVLCSSKTENNDIHKKEKRRETWCLGNLSRQTFSELNSKVKEKASLVKPGRVSRYTGPLLPFENLDEAAMDKISKEDPSKNNLQEDCVFPNHNSLMHVTSRRKAPMRRKSLHREKSELTEILADYEDLLIQFETERTMNEIHLAYLRKRLAEADLSKEEKCEGSLIDENSFSGHLSAGKGSRESEAIVVMKQLQEKITMLDLQKSSSQQNLDCIVDLATEQTISAKEKFDEDLKSVAHQTSMDIETVFRNHEKLKSFLEFKVDGLEREKITLSNQNLDLNNQIAVLECNAKSSADLLLEVTKHHELEKSEFLSQIEALHKEVSCLSSCSLAREKESIRKDLEKTKTKLKDMESKMKITMQERTKLEGEKACMERENKLLRGQTANLERDISKRDSVVGRRNDSVADRNSNVFDPKRGRGLSVAAEQEEYKKLEVLTFEMEATIASLDEELAVISGEKEEANLKAESLASDLYTTTTKLELSNVELATLKEEVSSLQSSLEEYKSLNQKLESSVNVLIQEKDELAMQLTDTLLLMEEEKTIWFTKEKASIEAIEDKSKSHNAEVALLAHQMSAVRTDLEFCRNQCKILEDKLTFSEQNVESEKKCSAEKSAEIDKLREDLLTSNDQFQRTREILNSKLEMLSSEHQCTCDKLEKLQMELVRLIKEREDLIALLGVLEAGSLLSKESQILTTKHDMENLSGRLSFLAAKIQKDRAISNKEMAKVRMRLYYTDLKLDAYRGTHKKTLDELELMNKKYEAAAEELKQKLAFYGVEVLKLKKELAAQAVRSS